MHTPVGVNPDFAHPIPLEDYGLDKHPIIKHIAFKVNPAATQNSFELGDQADRYDACLAVREPMFGPLKQNMSMSEIGVAAARSISQLAQTQLLLPRMFLDPEEIYGRGKVMLKDGSAVFMKFGAIDRLYGADYLRNHIGLLGLENQFKVPKKYLVAKQLDGPFRVPFYLKDSETHLQPVIAAEGPGLLVCAEYIAKASSPSKSCCLFSKEDIDGLFRIVESARYMDLDKSNLVKNEDGIWFIDTEIKSFEAENYFYKSIDHNFKKLAKLPAASDVKNYVATTDWRERADNLRRMHEQVRHLAAGGKPSKSDAFIEICDDLMECRPRTSIHADFEMVLDFSSLQTSA